jgi:alpha-glucoside transport system substrate-binding protein
MSSAGIGALYAVPVKANLKGLVWFNREHPPPQVPRTFEELTALSRDIAAGGAAPWCMGVASQSTSGWPGTDWIENILLNQSGAEAYEQWASGALEWTSPEVTGASEAWGELLAGSVHGGPLTAVLTEFANSGRPMFGDPPGCYLDHQASFIAGVYEGYQDGLRRGTDFGFFRFPPVSGEDSFDGAPAVVAADLAGMFNDTPQARELVRYLASEDAWREWADGGRSSVFTLTDTVDPGAYHDRIDAEIAGILASAPLCFDASDLMPATMANAFHHAVLEYLHDPQRLEAILDDLESVRTSIGDDQWLAMSCGRS